MYVDTCSNCNSYLDLTVRLVDKTPCYELVSTDSVQNVHVFLQLICNDSIFCSLVTNSYTSVLQKIRECNTKKSYIKLIFLYSCNRISS